MVTKVQGELISKVFVDNAQQCFAFTPQANLSTHNLNFHWRWRWWDWIQATFYKLFYSTYISTFLVHFVENIDNIILYVNVHTIFNSKRWWFEENRCKKCTLLQIPCCHLLLLHEYTFSTRAWEFEISTIYPQWNRITTICFYFFYVVRSL